MTLPPVDATPRMIDDELSVGRWGTLKAYNVSKLLLMHFGLILKNDPAFAGREVISLHPGLSNPSRWKCMYLRLIALH